MPDLKPGDLVVLSSGSMRMAVESVEGETINTVWCNEGIIGRDSFSVILLRKWEQREDTRGGGGDRHRGGKPSYGDRGDRGGDRDRGGKPNFGDRDDKPKGKPGWDGKPREKKYFRKD